MREDTLERLEQMYPRGFLVFGLEHDGMTRLTGDKLKESNILGAAYHAILMLASMYNDPDA